MKFLPLRCVFEQRWKTWLCGPVCRRLPTALDRIPLFPRRSRLTQLSLIIKHSTFPSRFFLVALCTRKGRQSRAGSRIDAAPGTLPLGKVLRVVLETRIKSLAQPRFQMLKIFLVVSATVVLMPSWGRLYDLDTLGRRGSNFNILIVQYSNLFPLSELLCMLKICKW